MENTSPYRVLCALRSIYFCKTLSKHRCETLRKVANPSCNSLFGSDYASKGLYSYSNAHITCDRTSSAFQSPRSCCRRSRSA